MIDTHTPTERGPMSPTPTALSPATQASLLRRVLADPHPRLALPTIASNASMSLADLQTMLKRHGYPDRVAMAKAAQRLEQPAEPDTQPDLEPGQRLLTVRLDQLHADPDNVRENAVDDEIDDLAASMTEVGLVQPIVARRHQGKLVVVAGHRRLAAARRLQWVDVPVIVHDTMRPDHVIAAMLIENGQRRDLDPIEEARGLRRLKVEAGCSDVQLARRVGRTQNHVSGRLALLDLTPEEQDRIRTGDLTLGNAVAQGRLNAGKVGKAGPDRAVDWHLGAQHELADQARARCTRLKHKQGRRVGGTACGACWESVIRTDERTHITDYGIRTGTCPACGAAPAAKS